MVVSMLSSQRPIFRSTFYLRNEFVQHRAQFAVQLRLPSILGSARQVLLDARNRVTDDRCNAAITQVVAKIAYAD